MASPVGVTDAGRSPRSTTTGQSSIVAGVGTFVNLARPSLGVVRAGTPAACLVSRINRASSDSSELASAFRIGINADRHVGAAGHGQEHGRGQSRLFRTNSIT